MKMKRNNKSRNNGLVSVLSIIMSTILSAGLLSGCGTAVNAADRTSDTAASEATAKDTNARTLTIGSGQGCDTLDPLNAYDSWYSVRYGICQTLTKMNDDMTISGWLADSYTVSDDNTVWTFEINDTAVFSNGNKLTAKSVKASLENVFANCTRAEEYFTPLSIEADGQTLTITTEGAEPILPNKLADPLFCIIDTSVDMTNIADEGPVGTGPFVVTSFDSISKECIVSANLNYWNGDVLLDSVDFIYTEDQSALSWGLQAGDYDAVYNIGMTSIADFENNSDYTISRTASGRTAHGFMNQNGVLKDKALREAILCMLDKETYCSVLLNGQYTAGKTLVTSAAPAYGYDELSDPNSYDPDRAAQLLDDAGYIDIDDDGWRETPEGEKLDLKYVYYTGRPEQELLVSATAQELAVIGIKISANVQETQTVIDMLHAGEYDMLCMSINVLNCADPENHMRTYFASDGEYNAYGWSDEAFDALLAKLSTESDPEERVSLVKDAEQILLDDAVCIFYCYPIMNFVMKTGITGLESSTADYYWISENTAKTNVD